MPAQVMIEARTPYRLILEGSASNGGFAVDDIKFQPLGFSQLDQPMLNQPLHGNLFQQIHLGILFQNWKHCILLQN